MRRIASDSNLFESANQHRFTNAEAIWADIFTNMTIGEVCQIVMKAKRLMKCAQEKRGESVAKFDLSDLNMGTSKFQLRQIRQFLFIFGDYCKRLVIDYYCLEHYRKRTLSVIQRWAKQSHATVIGMNQPDENEEEEYKRLLNDPVEQEKLLAEFVGDKTDDDDDDCVMIEPQIEIMEID